MDGVAAGFADHLVVLRMSATAAFIEGWRRVRRAPLIVAGLWLTTLLVAVPPALVLRGMIADHLGESVVAEGVAAGVDFDWWNEFLAQTSGIGQTFGAWVIGFAAVLRNLSGIADMRAIPLPIALVAITHVVVSLFVLGGVLDRLARDRATSSYGFFGACGVFFFRLFRLGAIAAVLYGTLFAALHPWLFDDVYPALTREVTAERTALAIRAGLYLVFGAVVLLVNLVIDYAKIRLVVEDRRSAIGALLAAVRFVRRQPGASLVLYLLNAAVFLVALAIYFVIAPGATGGWPLALAALVVGQAYIVARVVLRLLFAASQIALFQSRLAHAGYTARPTPRWPDSASAERVANARRILYFSISLFRGVSR
jgi:hypothetical protein